MDRIVFEHGGEAYDRRYPDGIPTSMTITLDDGSTFDSGLVMYPSGHARNTTANLEDILQHKAVALGDIALDDASPLIDRFSQVASLSVDELRTIMDFDILNREPID